MTFPDKSKTLKASLPIKRDVDRKENAGMCTYPGILSHSSSVNLPSYSVAWCTRPVELELVWLLCFVRRHPFELSNTSEVLWRYVPEKYNKIQRPYQMRLWKWVISRQQTSRRRHLDYRRLHRTLSYPRSSLQSLYWARWQSRPQKACWSSGSLSDHRPHHLKTQLLCPEAAGYQTLKTNRKSSQY